MLFCHINGYKCQNSKYTYIVGYKPKCLLLKKAYAILYAAYHQDAEQTVRLNKCACLLNSHIAVHSYYHDLYGNSLICRTDKVELIAT